MSEYLIYRDSRRSRVAHAVARISIYPTLDSRVPEDKLIVACHGVDVSSSRLVKVAEVGRETCKNCARVFLDRATPAHAMALAERDRQEETGLQLTMHLLIGGLLADGDAAQLAYPMVPRDEWMLTLDPATGLRYLAPMPV